VIGVQFTPDHKTTSLTDDLSEKFSTSAWAAELDLLDSLNNGNVLLSAKLIRVITL